VAIWFCDDVPIAWRTFTARAGTTLKGRGGTSKARNAATPIGALHNYALAVALGQVTRAIIGRGLDPCIGFLHSPKPSRLNLSYDVLELLRAEIAEAMFGFARKRVFGVMNLKLMRGALSGLARRWRAKRRCLSCVARRSRRAFRRLW
jgi:hypothetical protein